MIFRYRCEIIIVWDNRKSIEGKCSRKVFWIHWDGGKSKLSADQRCTLVFVRVLDFFHTPGSLKMCS
jgi:hypothetical protein